MSNFDVDAYNKLSLIATATKRLDTQLSNAGITREVLFSQLSPLFRSEANPYYVVCLIHRHYRLRNGERIVTSGNTSSPSTDTSASIVAERWLSMGTEVEYRLMDEPSSLTPPSPSFFHFFNEILAGYKIDTLGVCYAPGAPDFVPLLQTAGTGDREQFICTSSLRGPKVYQSSWNPTSKLCTMACDENFNVRTYNGLRLIADADQAFDEQLDKSPAGPITREDLFSELASLFVDNGNPGPYAVVLVHRHYGLNDGERMVTNGNSTQPSTTTSDIVPERWFSTGEEFEHRSIIDRASLPPSPSADFLAKFKAILDANGIDVLGVSFAPDTSNLAPGCVFLETPGPGDREQIVTQVPESSVQGPDIFQSSWVPTVHSETLSLGMSCKHNCQSCWDTQAASQGAQVEDAVKIKRGLIFEKFELTI